LKLSRDGWGGLAVLAASLLLFWGTLGLKDNPLVPIGPGFYPRAVLGITAVLSLWLLLADAFSGKRQPAREKESLNYSLVALMFAVFGLYVVALPYLGFRIATGLYVAATNALLARPGSARSWTGVVLLAVLTAFVTHLIFERYLLVLLPRGAWTGF
jgi:putative tricarboxylic transport membrane protein